MRRETRDEVRRPLYLSILAASRAILIRKTDAFSLQTEENECYCNTFTEKLNFI